MKRTLSFAKETAKRILRDPVSYVLLLLFPATAVAIVTLFGKTVKVGPTVKLLSVLNMVPGIAILSFSFTMIYVGAVTARDLEHRLSFSESEDGLTVRGAIFGYLISFFAFAFIQAAVCFASGYVAGLATGQEVSAAGMARGFAFSLPCALFFIALGLLFGVSLHETASVSACSVVMMLTGLFGGIWLDPEKRGTAFAAVARIFPFKFMTDGLKAAVSDRAKAFPIFYAAFAAAVVFLAVSILILRRKTQAKINDFLK